jgi:hypothetical protein
MPTTIHETKVETGSGSVQITNDVPLNSKKENMKNNSTKRKMQLLEGKFIY